MFVVKLQICEIYSTKLEIIRQKPRNSNDEDAIPNSKGLKSSLTSRWRIIPQGRERAEMVKTLWFCVKTM